MPIAKSLPTDINPDKITTRADLLVREIKAAYGPKLRQQLEFIGPGRAKQSFKDECDINRIMARYQVTGQLPENINPNGPRYVDVTGIEYQDAMLRVAEAQSLFERLPASVRYRFKNDPGEFLEFAQNPDNQPELIKMGLGRPGAEVAPPPPPPPPEARTAAPKAQQKGRSVSYDDEPSKGRTGEVPSLPLTGLEEPK